MYNVRMEYIDSELLPELFTAEMAAEELEMSARHINRLCKSGEIVAQRLGRQWIITRPALEMYKAKPKNGRGKYDRVEKGIKTVDKK